MLVEFEQNRMVQTTRQKWANSGAILEDVSVAKTIV